MWFLKSIEETLKDFNVAPATGLSEEEAQKRLQKYGPNELQEQKGKTIPQLFAEQLKDTLIYVLLGASVITLFM
jgi:Ca2+-transporting ATPase